MPSMTPGSAGTGSMSAAPSANGNGLYCSESLACSDVDVICTDADGINPKIPSTGSMVAA